MTERPLPADHTKLTEVLLDALKQAAAAHGIYEKNELAGVYDDAWPQWYAEHMTRTLTEAGYRLTLE